MPLIDENRLYVAKSDLSDRIYGGQLSEDGKRWVAKRDLTVEACAAVAEYIAHGQDLQPDEEVSIGIRVGETAYRITVALADDD